MKFVPLFIFLSLSLHANASKIKAVTPITTEQIDDAETNASSLDMFEIAEQEIEFDEQQLLLKQKKLKTHIEFCAPCHGKTGISEVPIYPNLAGQHQDYLLKQLLAFKYRRRKDTIMQSMVSRLNEDDMLELAKYYASLSNGITKINLAGAENETSN